MFNFQNDHADIKFYSEENQTIEQLMIRTALEKALTKKQREIYSWWAYDRFTFDEIGKRLNLNHSSAVRRVQTIQNKIRRWVENNIGAYEYMKLKQKARGA